MEDHKKYDKKAAIRAQYKSRYGNKQTGVGKALAVKDAFKKKFEREKYKRELKKRQNDYNATENEEVSKEDLKFLPPVANQDDEEAEQNTERAAPGTHSRKKYSKLTKAKLEFQDKVSEKKRLKEEREEAYKEKQTRIKEKKEKVLMRNKKFSQKTRKGQPVMAARMDLLLEEINQRWGKKK